jgi:prepilin-type N-terminal cleavage/methylation domain-containing protein
MAKTAGFTLVELMIVVAVISVLAVIAVPQFSSYHARSRVTQVVASSEAIRAAFASYAVSSQGNTYPPTAAITDFDSLRLVVNAYGGMLPESAFFTVNHYDFYDSEGDNVADTYSMRLIVSGVSSNIPGSQLLITPQGIFKCTPTWNPC